MAYTLTGDDRYLRHGWAYYNSLRKSDIADWEHVSYESQQMLPLLHHLALLPAMPTMTETLYRGGGPTLCQATRPAIMEIVLPEARDQAFEVWINLWSRGDVDYEILAPNGKSLQKKTAARGDSTLVLKQAADGVTGDYTLRLTCNDDTSLESFSTTLGTQRYVVPQSKGWFGGNGRWFFYVPKDCESFRITFGGPMQNEGQSAVEIIWPDDRTSRSVTPISYGKTEVVELKPTPAERGRVWSINLDRASIVDVQGIPRWFAGTPQGAIDKNK